MTEYRETQRPSGLYVVEAVPEPPPSYLDTVIGGGGNLPPPHDPAVVDLIRASDGSTITIGCFGLPCACCGGDMDRGGEHRFWGWVGESGNRAAVCAACFAAYRSPTCSSPYGFAGPEPAPPR